LVLGEWEVGLFITFEGIEGSGKSTQCRRLADRLIKEGISHVLTFEPGGTVMGLEIRRILLDSKNRHMSPLAELLLYEADRTEHTGKVIKPGLERGKWILCDRYYDATTVYQGYARGQDMAFIKVLNEKASYGIKPNMTFLLDCPVPLGLERALSREGSRENASGQDRFETEPADFHEAVRKGYLFLADQEPDRFITLNGTLPEQTLEDDIFEHLRPRIEKMRG
jgi:dTMP kinase